MKRELLCGLGIAVTVTALSAFNAMAENFTVTGTVTSVEPVYATRTINEPVKSCWTEQVPVYSQGKNNDAQAFGMDLEGAIIGGAIANNVLKGDNTGALGAIVGGLIGSDMKSKKNQVKDEEGKVVKYEPETIYEFMEGMDIYARIDVVKAKETKKKNFRPYNMSTPDNRSDTKKKSN